MGVKDRPPGSRSRLIANILFLVSGLFLLTNLLFPQLFANPIPQVPYSLFIDQVDDGEVARASVGQNQITYEVKAAEGEEATIFRTTPVLDLELPKRLEAKGVEFAAAPPPKNNWLGSILSWVIPPLIFVAIWQFFISRSGGVVRVFSSHQMGNHVCGSIADQDYSTRLLLSLVSRQSRINC